MTHQVDDELIQSIITGAESHFETQTGLKMTDVQASLSLGSWPTKPCKISDADSVTSITYLDENGNSVNYTDYTSIAWGTGIVISFEESPDLLEVTDFAPIIITYNKVSSTTDHAKLIIMMLIGHYYENREAVVSAPGIVSVEVPQGIEQAIVNYRTWYI